MLVAAVGVGMLALLALLAFLLLLAAYTWMQP